MRPRVIRDHAADEQYRTIAAITNWLEESRSVGSGSSIGPDIVADGRASGGGPAQLIGRARAAVTAWPSCRRRACGPAAAGLTFVRCGQARP